MDHLPVVGSPVEVAFADGRTLLLAVLSRDDDFVTVRTPLDDTSAGRSHAKVDVVAVGWRAGTSWYVAQVRDVLVSDGDTRWQLMFADEPRVTNRRRYVRGGGGEPVEVRDEDSSGTRYFASGTVLDVSEGGARCELPAFHRRAGDDTLVRLTLDDRTIEIPGSVSGVHRVARGVEAIVVFRGLSESDAQAIRRYLFQRELAERRTRSR